jgi:hypothetical protein
MAEANIWSSIEKHGLLSTSALLDLFEVDGDLRRKIETEHRPESITIHHREYGTAVIRDQKPMRESALRTCLRGMTPREWYLKLNGQVFPWATGTRVQTLLSAKAYRDRKHTVITVDTAALMQKYADQIVLSPINSGSTIYNPRPRGKQTFLSMGDYPFVQRRKLRGIANAVAEVAMGYAIPDLREFVICVEHRRNGRVLEVLYSKD